MTQEELECIERKATRDYVKYHGNKIGLLLNEDDKIIIKLQQENEVLKKALELACERVKYFEEMQDKEMGHYEIFGYDTNYDLKALVDDFIEQAKESMK